MHEHWKYFPTFITNRYQIKHWVIYASIICFATTRTMHIVQHTSRMNFVSEYLFAVLWNIIRYSFVTKVTLTGLYIQWFNLLHSIAYITLSLYSLKKLYHIFLGECHVLLHVGIINFKNISYNTCTSRWTQLYEFRFMTDVKSAILYEQRHYYIHLYVWVYVCT